MITLPAELLDHICNYVGSFEDECRDKTLLSIMLSSKALYNAARPELYRRLDSLKGSNKFPLVRALQLVTDQPDVADFVRELYVRDPGGRSWSKATHELDESLRSRLLNVAGSVNLSEDLRRDLHAGIGDGTRDSLMCVLLILCRNLTLIYKETVHSFSQKLMMRVLQESGTLEGVLDHLHTLNTRAINSYIGQDLSYVLPCWTVPSLRSYGGEHIHLINCPPAIDHATSNLRILTLTDSVVDPSGLERVLILCPELTHLQIEFGDPEAVGPSIPYGDLGDVLRRHESQVDFLIFTKTNTIPHEENFPPHCESALGDLTCMKRLKNLYIDWDALLGSKDSSYSQTLLSCPGYLAGSLPDSLELIMLWTHDYISDDLELVDAQLVELMTSDGHKNLHNIMAIDRDRDSFTHTTPPGWNVSLNKANGDPEDCLILERV